MPLLEVELCTISANEPKFTEKLALTGQQRKALSCHLR